MANQEQLKVLRKGVDSWNEWRKQNPKEKINLSRADLKQFNLTKANLQGASLYRTDLKYAELKGADLQGAILKGADLQFSSMIHTKLQNANLQGANLVHAFLIKTQLQDAKLFKANLEFAILEEANLQGANLKGADLNYSTLNDTNLKDACLVGARLWEANLRKAILTGTELFGIQTYRWNLDRVICKYAYFEKGQRMDFTPGEFERLYAGNNIIEIEYQDGISKLEFASLPALMQLIESHQSGVKLSPRRMETIGNTMRVSFLAEGHKQEDLPSLQIEAEKLQNLQRKLAKQVDENKALSDEKNAFLLRLTKTEGKLEATEKAYEALLSAMTMSRSGDVFNLNGPFQGIAGKVHNSTVKQTFNINTEAHNQEDIEREIDEAPNETIADAVKDSAKSLIKQLYAETKNGVKQQIAKSLVGMLGESIQQLPSLSTVLGQLS